MADCRNVPILCQVIKDYGESLDWGCLDSDVISLLVSSSSTKALLHFFLCTVFVSSGRRRRGGRFLLKSALGLFRLQRFYLRDRFLRLLVNWSLPPTTVLHKETEHRTAQVACLFRAVWVARHPARVDLFSAKFVCSFKPKRWFIWASSRPGRHVWDEWEIPFSRVLQISM